MSKVVLMIRVEHWKQNRYVIKWCSPNDRYLVMVSIVTGMIDVQSFIS